MSDQERVFQYMKDKNRPYSATDIFNNLNKDISKSSISKCLESLVEEGKINEKLYGKQKVYLINQDILYARSSDETLNLENRFIDLRKEFHQLTQDLNKEESELKMLKSSITFDEAKLRLEKAQQEILEKEEKLSQLKKNGTEINYEERNKILSDRTNLIKEWRKRKRMAKDMMDAVLEHYPKTKKQFLEEVGIELDEDFNVTIPDD